MVEQKPIEFALFLTDSAMKSLRRHSGSQYWNLATIRKALVDALPDTSNEKIRVQAIIQKELDDTPW
jgi:hypothetical protein